MLSFEKDQIVTIDTEDVTSSDFMPLDCYLKSVEAKKQFSTEDLAFVGETAKKTFRKTLNLPDPDAK